MGRWEQQILNIFFRIRDYCLSFNGLNYFSCYISISLASSGKVTTYLVSCINYIHKGQTMEIREKLLVLKTKFQF